MTANDNDRIARLFEREGLGALTQPVTAVSGGFMHRMYKAVTAESTYAVKLLNPVIMARPRVMDNYKRAEALESILEERGIPILPALAVNGRKMLELDGAYFYIFRWHSGRMTDWANITAEQCRTAGRLQGMIHSAVPEREAAEAPEPCLIDWGGYIAEAEEKAPAAGELLKENRELLEYAQAELNKARAALPRTECITDEDMDPKNVMWDGDEPAVIDLENLEYGSPVSSALQLSLQWAGITTLELDTGKIKAFFEGYLEAYDSGFRDYGSVFGLAYTWLEWLEYNVQRALGACSDEAERETGMSEVRNTLARIRCIRDAEDSIREILGSLFV